MGGISLKILRSIWGGGGEVGVVENCDPNEWSKVEIEAICRDFGYLAVSRLWYIVPRDNQENKVFHLVKDDNDAMFMTELVRGRGQIHVYVEHPVHDPILINRGNGVTLEVVVGNEYDDFVDVSDFEGEPAYDAYYNGKGYFCSSGSNDEDRSFGGDDDLMILMVISISMRVTWMMILAGMIGVIGMAVLLGLWLVMMVVKILLPPMEMVSKLILMLK